MNKIAIYGAGSYAQEVACMIDKINHRVENDDIGWEFVGYYDDDMSLWGKELLFGKVLGGMQSLNAFAGRLNLVVGIANTEVIRSIINQIKKQDVVYPNIIDPDTSYTHKDSFKIGEGNIIGEGCRIGPYVSIGNFNVVVNDSVFGHDVVLGDYNVFFPAVRLSGKVNVENNNTFGVGTVILPGLSVASWDKFAPGTILQVDTESDFIYFGNPARKMKKV